jgi:hypothetical protein
VDVAGVVHVLFSNRMSSIITSFDAFSIFALTAKYELSAVI